MSKKKQVDVYKQFFLYQSGLDACLLIFRQEYATKVFSTLITPSVHLQTE